jgi:CubicO group peptidase (beta-lactamase class C family)
VTVAPDRVHAVLRDGVLREESDPRPVIWWSLTKSVIAAAALRLVDLGRLALDEPVANRPYSLRHLLQHTAGVPTYRGPEYHDAVARGDPPWPSEQMLQWVRSDTLLFPPGEGWAYSNIGYYFVSRMIKAATGEALGPALRSLVLDPLGLAATGIVTTPEDLEPTVWGNPTGYHPGWVYHGLLTGPAEEAVRFVHGVGALLGEELWAAMLTVHHVGGDMPGRPWTEPHYSLGLMIGAWREAGRVYGHSGVGSTVAAVYAFPDLPGAPVVGAFAPGSDEAVVENEALKLAMDQQAPPL